MQTFFSNPPTATVPHTAMSNRLIGLLHKRGEIKKKCRVRGRCEDGGREEDGAGVNGLITA